MPVAIVTDSTASLPSSVVAARELIVVPLQVIVGEETYDEVEGGASPELVAAALRDRKKVTTSRPNPAQLLEVYEQAVAAGASEIVSIHLSAELSGTYDSARQAARKAPVKVTVIDSRQAGIGTGLVVLAAADARDAGDDAAAVAKAARVAARRTTSLFYVDTLDYLRRGGRVSAASAFVGSALAVKPILTLDDGQVVPLEKVRTSGKALARLEELAVEHAGEDLVSVAVCHLANPERAEALAASLGERLDAQLDGSEVLVGEVSAVLGAHIGKGMVAVSITRR